MSGSREATRAASEDSQRPTRIPTSSYVCEICRRSYRPRDALTRHRNTHSRNKKYACSICRCVFYRRDLLVRHSQIHYQSQGHNETAGRQRAAIACTNCRRAKIKCSGRIPCAACQHADRQCVQSKRSVRLSLQEALLTVEDDDDVPTTASMGYSPQHSPESTQDPLPVIAPASTDFQRVPEARVENSIPDDLFLSPTSVTGELSNLALFFLSLDWRAFPITAVYPMNIFLEIRPAQPLLRSLSVY